MTILVLVADGAYAKLYTTRSQTGELDLWEEYAHPASRLKNTELTTDGPGIGQDSIGQGRHSMGHESEAQQLEALPPNMDKHDDKSTNSGRSWHLLLLTRASHARLY